MTVKYTFKTKEVLVENMPIFAVDILCDDKVIKSTTQMGEAGCRKWALIEIARMQRNDMKSLTSSASTSWIEETFGKKKKEGN